jgi:hypothetical protein
VDHASPADAFNVPLDGVSWNGNMYVVFSTDRRQAGICALMGRSILARSDNNGLDFKPFKRYRERVDDDR